MWTVGMRNIFVITSLVSCTYLKKATRAAPSKFAISKGEVFISSRTLVGLQDLRLQQVRGSLAYKSSAPWVKKSQDIVTHVITTLRRFASGKRLSSKKATAAQHHQSLGLIYGCGESFVYVPVLWPQVPEFTVRLELNWLE